MRRSSRWAVLGVVLAAAALAGCKGGGGYTIDPSLNADKANPQAATRQQCIDAGYPTGTVQYTQCITKGAGLPKN